MASSRAFTPGGRRGPGRGLPVPRSGSHAVPEVGAGLDSGVRWRALKALRRFGERVVPALIQALNESHDPAVRRFAADALGRIGPAARPALPALARAIADVLSPVVRGAAARAVATINSGRAQARRRA